MTKDYLLRSQEMTIPLQQRATETSEQRFDKAVSTIGSIPAEVHAAMIQKQRMEAERATREQLVATRIAAQRLKARELDQKAYHMDRLLDLRAKANQVESQRLTVAQQRYMLDKQIGQEAASDRRRAAMVASHRGQIQRDPDGSLRVFIMQDGKPADYVVKPGDRGFEGLQSAWKAQNKIPKPVNKEKEAAQTELLRSRARYYERMPAKKADPFGLGEAFGATDTSTKLTPDRVKELKAAYPELSEDEIREVYRGVYK